MESKIDRIQSSTFPRSLIMPHVMDSGQMNSDEISDEMAMATNHHLIEVLNKLKTERDEAINQYIPLQSEHNAMKKQIEYLQMKNERLAMELTISQHPNGETPPNSTRQSSVTSEISPDGEVEDHDDRKRDFNKRELRLKARLKRIEREDDIKQRVINSLKRSNAELKRKNETMGDHCEMLRKCLYDMKRRMKLFDET